METPPTSHLRFQWFIISIYKYMRIVKGRIENARDRWYASAECAIKSMTDYIESKGMLRDAQINAIKTYLFLKISCESRPLADLL